ncbi:nucleotidyltransferase domain-containing protein [Candidatus Microgenomates bacterium]|nr:nucleotidyltransferase domain-containing protein [Candidatus Microgenomates bacterium]
MVKGKNININIIDTVRKYSDLVKLKGIDIKQTILFGSHAKGNARRYSDIDICIVSDQFGQDSLDELQILLHLSHDIDERIEPIPFTTRELADKYSSLACEIRKYGVRVV